MTVQNAAAITTTTTGTSVGTLTLTGSSIALSEAIAASGAVSLTETTGTGAQISQTATADLSTPHLTLNLAGTATANLTTDTTGNNVAELTGVGYGSEHYIAGQWRQCYSIRYIWNTQNVTVQHAGAITTTTTGTSLGTHDVDRKFDSAQRSDSSNGAVSLTETTGTGTQISQTATADLSTPHLTLNLAGTATADLTTDTTGNNVAELTGIGIGSEHDIAGQWWSCYSIGYVWIVAECDGPTCGSDNDDNNRYQHWNNDVDGKYDSAKRSDRASGAVSLTETTGTQERKYRRHQQQI